MRYVLACVLLLWAAPVQAAVVWFAGNETGDVLEYTQRDTGSNTIINSSAFKSGAYSTTFREAAANSGFGISKKGLGLTTAYVRVQFRPETGASGNPNSIQSVFRFLNAAQTIVFELQQQTNGKLCFSYNGGACVATSTTATNTLQTWYLIEAKFVVHASAGGMELKINGTVEFTSFATNTSSITTLDQLQIGPARNIAANQRFILYDDMAISDSGYLGTGSVIARQGASGTPTYTAWTKNSCTSSLIENCWSQTPVNTTPNASSSTSTQAQTMLVATFGSTQSGHGTEIINDHDTINGCKVSMNAKGASGTPSIKIRRRLSGADTDTTMTITTADAYYDDAVWTTTPVVLRGATMEIGVVQNQNTVAETVEDMWMQCDFAASTNIQRKVIQE